MTNQEAIDILEEVKHNDDSMYAYNDAYCEALDMAIEALKAQESRYGEWKWSHGGECSECGFHNSNFDYKFCPMCGAVMDSERRNGYGTD